LFIRAVSEACKGSSTELSVAVCPGREVRIGEEVQLTGQEGEPPSSLLNARQNDCSMLVSVWTVEMVVQRRVVRTSDPQLGGHWSRAHACT
jgi:hypothetical protein